MNRYAEYRDSGIEWIGKIPSHWNVIPNRNFLREKSIKNVEGLQNLSVYRDYGVIPRDSRDDNHNKVSEDTSHYKLVEVGDFVLNKMKCWMGSLGVSDYQGIVSPAYTVCEPTREINRKFFHYLLRSASYIQIYSSLSYGIRIAQWELRFHDFKTICSVYPPVSEQFQISQFLDRKIPQIDSLIEKLEQKTELLKEQRKTLISQCVTKGLDPNVKMKVSGVEWAGEIPSHWKISRLRYLHQIMFGGQWGSDPTDSEKFVFVVRVSDFDYTRLKISKVPTARKLIIDSTSPKLIRKGDLVLEKSGGGEKTPVGRLVMVTDEPIEPTVNSNFTILIRTNPNKTNPRFLTYLYYVGYIVGITGRNLKQTTGIQNLDTKNLFRELVAVPPIREQVEISKFLDKNASQINSLIEKLQQKIELLKEYRQSLISNVVTGKVKVTKDAS